jgi:ATP-dependent DNA helicase RecQ
MPAEASDSSSQITRSVETAVVRRLTRKVPWLDAADDRPGWVTRYASCGARLRSLPEAIVQQVSDDLSGCWIAASDLPSFMPADDETMRTLAMARKILQRGSMPFIDPRTEQRLLESAGVKVEVRGRGLIGVRPVTPLDAVELVGFLGFSQGCALDSSLAFDSEAERTWLNLALQQFGVGRNFFAQAPLEALVTGLGRESVGNRRVDFLFASHATTRVVEIDGLQHTDDPVDSERDALLAAVKIPVDRISAHDAGNGDIPKELVAALEGALGARTWNPLVHGPIQIQRLAHAMVEAVRRGFLAGDSWILELEDDTSLATVGLPEILDLLRAIDDLWGGLVLPRFVQVVASDSTMAWEFDGQSFVEVEPEAHPPDVRVFLDLGVGALHQLPIGHEIPTIVVRDAPLPIQVLENSGEPTTRTKPVLSEEDLKGPLRTILRAVFAVEDFRDGQLEAVCELVEGRDCVVLLPTGAGKSLVYQMAGLVLPGRTLVVDPLVSLMEDQERSLRAFGIDRAVAISSFTSQSGQRDAAMSQVQSGDALFVFISPERLQSPDFRQALRVLAASTPINLAVVDEAHCVSEWGHDFRTAYLNVGRTLRTYGADSNGSPPPLLALTGTASRAVLKDLINDLGVSQESRNSLIKPKSFDRAELGFEIHRPLPTDSLATLQGVLQSMPGYFGENAASFFNSRSKRKFSGLVFVPHANGKYGIQSVADSVAQITNSDVLVYSGQAPKGRDSRAWEHVKRDTARRFMSDDASVMVSTKAFGMGIDKPNIRFVIHYGIPGSIESYYQEVGRAGRDREKSKCVLIVSELDSRRNSRLLDDSTQLEDLHEHVASRPKGGAGSDDVDRQLFFFTKSFLGVATEVASVLKILDELAPFDDTHACKIGFGSSREESERAIHRLALLGVAQDYTVDWGAKRFDITVRESSAESIAAALVDFIERSQPGRSAGLLSRISAAAKGDARRAIEECTLLLTEFIYDTVALARRRSLREMLLAARESAGDVEFRRRILDYLQEGDVAPLIERLADAPVFSLLDWTTAIGQIGTMDEAQEWRGSTARLLTSYPEQPGLLIGRGMSELNIPGGDINEGCANLSAGLKSASENYQSTPEDLGHAAVALLAYCLRADRIDAAMAVFLAAEPIVSKPYRERLVSRLQQAAPDSPVLAVFELPGLLQNLDSVLDDVLKQGVTR